MKPKKGRDNSPGDIFRSRLPGTGTHRVCWEGGRIVIPTVCVNAGKGLSPAETGKWIVSYHSPVSLLLTPIIVWGAYGEGIRSFLEQEIGKVTDKTYWTLYVESAMSFVMGTKCRVTIPKYSLVQYLNLAKADKDLNGDEGDRIIVIKPGMAYFLITGVRDHLADRAKAQPQPLLTMPAQETRGTIKKQDEKGS